MHVTTMRPESVERRRWWILGVLAFSVLVIVLDNSVLNVALPAIVRQLHASSSELQWMVDAYSLVFAGLLLTMGSLGDKYGRRPALQIGFLVFGVGSAISAIVGSPGQLIASRAVMGSVRRSSCRPRCRSSPTCFRPTSATRFVRRPR